MRLDIAVRLRPFSHIAGTACPIPHSTWQIQVFPTLLRLKNFMGQYAEVKFPFSGPFRQFTVEQDLEKGGVRVFGFCKEGYFRYWVTRKEQGISIEFEKHPQKGESILIPAPPETALPNISNERLSLGMHKAADWEMVQRRQDLKEIFPVWLKLGNSVPKLKKDERRAGTLQLLDACRQVIQSKEKTEIVQAFLNLFNAGFHSLFAPRLIDDQHQGLAPELSEFPVDLSPFHLLKEGAELIRSLFFVEEGEKVSLLPSLPPEFHAGRFADVPCGKGDLINFEWSKKLLRRAIWRSSSEREVHLSLQKAIRTFRVRTSLKDRGKKVRVEEPLRLKAEQTFFLDRFEK